MAFVKIRKTKPYFKRYQTKFRRRREGKTDYYARKALIMQDRDKYNTPKYRLVVRRTNAKIICQIIYATIKGDRVLCQANSAELKRFGLKNALTNYAASYATGLLIARRLLKQLGMEKLYAGNQKLDGAEYHVSDHVADERRPFKCFLDVGLTRTTNGNRVFAALKGASDGGLDIPHNTRRFPGFSRADDEEKYDAKKHRERIFGVHVQNYIAQLKKEGDEAYKKQFNLWDQTLKAAGVDTVEKLFTKIHSEIRAKPEADKKKHEKKAVAYTDKRKTVIQTGKATYTRARRLTRDERLKNVEKKIAIAQKAAAKKGK